MLGRFPPPEADVVLSLLRAEGIDVYEVYEAISPILGVLVGPIGERSLYVKIEDLERAREILGGREGAKGQV